MELIMFNIPKSTSKLTIAPIGDIQWSGEDGPTAQESLKRHIDRCMKLGAYFVGMGDFIDLMSPSNRRRFQAADLYDTAKQSIWNAALELTEKVYEKFLIGTEKMWIGKVEGHHFFEHEGEHTDEILAKKLKTKFLGTSAFIRIPVADFTLWMHHGIGGGGKLPASPLNALYHTSAGLPGADVYAMGHCTKLGTSTLARPFPVWGKKNGQHDLNHKEVRLVSCGGFSKSNIVGHCVKCARPRGDYAEQSMMTPSPLKGPLITIDLEDEFNHVSVTV